MLTVKTKLKSSEISGIGLFADEPIKKGAIVWKFNQTIDLLFSDSDIKKLSNSAKEQFLNYAFLDKYHKQYMLCGDDARFFNHSKQNNCNDGLNDITIAVRDIEVGEELTVNYLEFYGDIERIKEII